MRRTFALLAALALAGFVALAGQASQSLPINASISVFSPVALSKVSDLIFGLHSAAEGVITCSQCTPGRWAGQGAAGRSVDISFTLPTVLTRSGNTATVPIPFGSSSGPM